MTFCLLLNFVKYFKNIKYIVTIIRFKRYLIINEINCIDICV